MKGNADNKSALCSFLMLNKSAINQVFASAPRLRFTESEHVHFCSHSLMHHVRGTQSLYRWVRLGNTGGTHSNPLVQPSYLPAIIPLADSTEQQWES